MAEPKETVHGGDIYRNPSVTDYSVNSNPLGVPEAVRKSVQESADRIMYYPDVRCDRLRESISDFERIEKEKYERAINESYDYILSTDTILGSDCLLYFVARELNILDKVIKYDDSPQALKDIAIEQMDEVFDEETGESFTTYVLNTDINEKRIYLNVKRILNGIIFGDGTYQLIEASQDTNKKDKGIVLEVKFRKKDK